MKKVMIMGVGAQGSTIAKRSYFLREAEKLKITVDRTVTTRLF